MNFEMMLKSLEALSKDEKYIITVLSNASALIKQFMPNTNWVGFYLKDQENLILGPFQGLPACEIIPFDKGVCGKCAREQQTIIVNDVHTFPGHIACDSASNSEIVVPIIINDQLFGVLDIDSPLKERFNEIDKEHLQKAVKILEAKLTELLKQNPKF